MTQDTRPVRSLTAEEAERLNARTYRGQDPADFFEYRLRAILVAVTTPTSTDELVLGRYRLPTPSSVIDCTAFAAIDAYNLLHHAGEVLWLLFLSSERAARSARPCPRLDLASIRTPELRQLQRDFLAMPENEMIARVRTALAIDLSAQIDDPLHRLDEGVRSLSILLRLLAIECRDNPGLFNGTKHGFGTGAQRSAIKIEIDDVVGIEQTSLWLEHLERAKADKDNDEWVRVSTPIELDRLVGLAGEVVAAIRTFWSMAAVRWGEAPTGDEPAIVRIGINDADQLLAIARQDGLWITRRTVGLSAGADGEYKFETTMQVPKGPSNDPGELA